MLTVSILLGFQNRERKSVYVQLCGYIYLLYTQVHQLVILNKTSYSHQDPSCRGEGEEERGRERERRGKGEGGEMQTFLKVIKTSKYINRQDKQITLNDNSCYL